MGTALSRLHTVDLKNYKPAAGGLVARVVMNLDIATLMKAEISEQETEK